VNYLNTAWDKSKLWLGKPVQAAEETSRITAFLSFYETLSEPGAMERLETTLVEGNHRYSTFKANNPSLDPAMYASLFLIDDTHGIFGKLGRGKNQQGLMGALILPFMQHPLMMMGFMHRMMQGGAVNKATGMYIIASTMMMAGLYGIPGWELWKEMIEMFHKRVSGREIDIHHEMKKVMIINANLSPAFAEGMTEGWVKPLLGIDISRRIGLPVFFQNALIPLMQGRDGIDQFTGVAGSKVGSAMTNIDRVASGEISPLGMLIETLMPNGLVNMYKAVAVYPKEGLRTGKGTQIMTGEDWSAPMRIMKGLGAMPSQAAREYEKRNAERLAGTGWRWGYNNIINKIARAKVRRIKAYEEGDTKKLARLDERINELYEKLDKFSLSANKQLNKDYRNGVKTAVKRRVDNELYPDIPVREFKTVDYPTIDRMYERKKD
jgi:hypothetical protein